jgi:multidrug resistance efflux pump
VATDQGSAVALQDQLAQAKTKLEKVQAQLKGAEARLTALNKAASRQAALNAAARRSSGAATTTSSRSSGGEHHDD